MDIIPTIGFAARKKRFSAPNTPVRFASVQNRSYEGTASSSGRNRYYFRGKHVLGANMYSLQLGAMNWHIQSGGQTNTGNAFTYEGISIEGPNGVVVPVTWAGSASKTLADGDNHILSDVILASAFGTTLDRGDEIWIKGIISVTNANEKVPVGGVIVGDVSGAQTGFYASASTTPSSIYAPGVFTFTGTAPATNNNVHQPILLGQPFVDGLQYFGIGDSILYGTSDDSSQGAFGRGFFQRAMHNNFSDPVPSANFSRPSIGTGPFSGGNTKWRSWLPYANRGVDELLTNNVDNQTVSTMQSGISGLWQAMRDGGIQKIIRTQLMANTSSTDSWATTANQTPVNANWDTGGRVEQMNAWFPTRVGINIDAFCSLASVLDTDARLWKANGIASRMTNDGAHLYNNGANGVGAETAGAALRTARLALG